VSFTQLFGLGTSAAGRTGARFHRQSCAVREPVLAGFRDNHRSPSTTAIGDPIVASGDASGLDALENVAIGQQSFQAAGNRLTAQSTSLSNYVGAFYQDIATQTQTASTNSTTQSDRLSEAQARQSQTSGVNLDDELSKMVVYQQAYSAGARMLQVAQALDQTLQQDVT
jgi:flagellar hook-associated protein 1